MTAYQYVEALKTKLGLTSDYAVAKALNVPRATVSNWRTRRSHFDDAIALRVAALLGIDPAQIIAAAHADRARGPELKQVWQRITDRVKNAAVLAFVVLGAGAWPPPPAYAGAGFDISVLARPSTGRNTHCRQWLRRVLAWLRGRA
jgi:hypothetical protein